MNICGNLVGPQIKLAGEWQQTQYVTFLYNDLIMHELAGGYQLIFKCLILDISWFSNANPGLNVSKRFVLEM